MAVIVLGLFWLAGIYLGTLGALPGEVATAIGLTAAILAALWWPRAAIRLATLGIVVLLVGMARSQAALPVEDGHSLAAHNDQGRLYLRGVVDDSPIARGSAVELRVAVRELKRGLDNPWEPMRGSVLVRLPLQPAYRYGDYLELQGALETPPNFDLFSYRDYLARQGITSLMHYPQAMLLGEERGWAPFALLHDLRNALARALAQSLPEPQAGLAQGILLGQRGAIPSELTDAFRRTNTTHVIAISGTNVTLVVGLLLLASRATFGRLGATLFASLGVVAYALLVGTSPSVVRATIMGVLFVWGSYFGRQRDATVGLIVAAVAMTLIDPLVLFDLGFQLSFLATAGLVLLAMPIQGRLTFLPGWLSGLLAVTVAAEAATLPLIVLISGQVSLVGPVANLTVPPLLPVVMLTGAATAFGGLLWLPLGQLAGYVAWLFLTLMVWAVETLGALPGAALPVGRPGVALVLAYYALLAGYLLHRLPPTTGLHLAWRALWSRVPTAPALGALAIAAVLSWSAALSVPADALRLVVLDVGQGDAILVRTPQHKVLVDGGPSPEAIANALGRRLPFWDRGLDLVVLTHPNEDHLAGLITVLERFPVRQVLETGPAPAGASYARWQELIRERGIPRAVAEAGQAVDLGQGVYLHVLHPSRESEGFAEINDKSIVLRLTAGAFSALLTGDLGPEGAAELLASAAELRSTVLKVPHHGSRSGLGEGLLDAVSPELAIVSVGRGNRFGHPAPETLALLRKQGTRVYRTDVNGTVEVVVSEAGYQVWSER